VWVLRGVTDRQAADLMASLRREYPCGTPRVDLIATETVADFDGAMGNDSKRLVRSSRREGGGGG
jgi:hypothetical protein